MELTAVLPRDNLIALVRQLMPLKLMLDEQAGSDRYLLLFDPDRIQLVPGAGLRVTAKAKLSWPVIGLRLPVAFNALSLLLRPKIAGREQGAVLVFQVEIEQIDLAGLPALLDTHLTEKVNKALSERRVELVWDYARTLSHAVRLPPMLQRPATFHIEVADGQVEINADSLRLTIGFRARITRSGPDTPA